MQQAVICSPECRSLEFPIDCPVCRLELISEQREQQQQQQQIVQQHADAAEEPDARLTITQRSLSDVVTSSQLGSSQQLTEYIMYSQTAVDPEHATQLHAVHSTPSLGSTGHLLRDDSEYLSKAYDEEEDSDRFHFKAQHHGVMPLLQRDSPRVRAASPAYVSARPDHAAAVQLGASKSKQNGMRKVPSFPIIASSTPMTPLLIPVDGAPVDSRAIFSPHQSAPVVAPTPAQQPAQWQLNRVAADPQQTHNGFPNAAQQLYAYDAANKAAAASARVATLGGNAAPAAEQLALVGMRSLSLGGLDSAHVGVMRGLSSPADWSAAALSRSSSSGSSVSRAVSTCLGSCSTTFSHRHTHAEVQVQTISAEQPSC